MATTPRIPRGLREQREREQQERERQERELSLVRAAEPREVPDEEHPALEESLEELVDRRLRHIIRTLNPVSEVKELNYAIKTAVSFLAVKAKLPPGAYGTDLDETG